MDIARIISLMQSNTYVQSLRFYKLINGDGQKTCDKCLRFAGQIFTEKDANIPLLPFHPNCSCHFIEVNQEEYLKQKNFQFGNMSPDRWDRLKEEDKYLWCNVFRDRFGKAIDKYAIQYNIPKQLIAGVIANEMLDWKFPDGTLFDGITGGGIGYAQIAIKTARDHGILGNESYIKEELNSYEGSVEIASKILKDYFDEYRNTVKKNQLGSGFVKSELNYMAKPYIVQRENFVNMKVPEWIFNTMCAVWNSGIEVIHAKDKIGEQNYKNAYYNGLNSSILMKYLPKLVNE